MKQFILRLMLRLTGYVKNTRQLNTVTFRVGQTPSALELKAWDFNHDGKRDIQVTVYYQELISHDYFKFNSLEMAMAEYKLAENFLGKKVS